jgi:hypothetical protein
MLGGVLEYLFQGPNVFGEVLEYLFRGPNVFGEVLEYLEQPVLAESERRRRMASPPWGGLPRGRASKVVDRNGER